MAKVSIESGARQNSPSEMLAFAAVGITPDTAHIFLFTARRLVQQPGINTDSIPRRALVRKTFINSKKGYPPKIMLPHFMLVDD